MSVNARALHLILPILLVSVSASASDKAVLGPAQLAVIINQADPLSVATGEYYVQRRHVPPQNVVRVSFAYERSVMPELEFSALKAAIDARLPPSVEAYALTWARPYRVECMSITSAFAFGFDPRYCASGCETTQLSRYYDSSSARPYTDLRIRPAMTLAPVTASQGRALIDRGVRSDGTDPVGTAYLLVSGDAARDVRAADYSDAVMLAGDRVRTVVLHSAGIVGRTDIMFYFIGARRVPGLDTDRFLPGAVADHLTSAGGALTDGSQMSSLRWLEAGATGSYGTVVEPCNITAKFPNPGLLMRHYLAGETLIESYWKSVAMPGQGIFVGEPLATPYRH